MKLRIISDIHCDINSGQSTNFNFSPDDFVICCGDISGDRFITKKWINENIVVGSKVYIDPQTKELKVQITPESFVFNAERKIEEV